MGCEQPPKKPNRKLEKNSLRRDLFFFPKLFVLIKESLKMQQQHQRRSLRISSGLNKYNQAHDAFQFTSTAMICSVEWTEVILRNDHTVFENYPKCFISILGIIRQFLSFLETLLYRKLHYFKNSPKLTIFGIFNEINVARFARNVE